MTFNSDSMCIVFFVTADGTANPSLLDLRRGVQGSKSVRP